MTTPVSERRFRHVPSGTIVTYREYYSEFVPTQTTYIVKVGEDVAGDAVQAFGLTQEEAAAEITELNGSPDWEAHEVDIGEAPTGDIPNPLEPTSGADENIQVDAPEPTTGADPLLDIDMNVSSTPEEDPSIQYVFTDRGGTDWGINAELMPVKRKSTNDAYTPVTFDEAPSVVREAIDALRAPQEDRSEPQVDLPKAPTEDESAHRKKLLDEAEENLKPHEEQDESDS